MPCTGSPRAMPKYGVVLFNTTSSAMQAEAVLSRREVSIRMIPTPRELSSDCGIAIRFDLDVIEIVRSILKNAHVEVADILPIP